MAFTLVADSLIIRLPASRSHRQTRDSSPEAKPLGGTAQSDMQLAGSLDSLEAGGTCWENLEWQRFLSPE